MAYLELFWGFYQKKLFFRFCHLIWATKDCFHTFHWVLTILLSLLGPFFWWPSQMQRKVLCWGLPFIHALEDFCSIFQTNCLVSAETTQRSVLCYLHKYLCLVLFQFFFCCAFEVVGNADCGQNVHYRLDRPDYSCIVSKNIFFNIRGLTLTCMCNVLTRRLWPTVPLPFCLVSGWTFKDYRGPLLVFQRAHLEAVDLTREIGSVHTAVRGTEGPEQRGSKRRRE